MWQWTLRGSRHDTRTSMIQRDAWQALKKETAQDRACLDKLAKPAGVGILSSMGVPKGLPAHSDT